MEENRKNDMNEEQRSSDQDQLRSNTMNEMIREANGDPDLDLNELRDTDEGAGNAGDNSGLARNRDRSTLSQGMSWNPNDTSGVRSGGTADMDNQTSRGAGENTGRRLGSGSGLAPKMGTTGSDFDGQNSTS